MKCLILGTKVLIFFDLSQEMMKYCDFYTFYLVLSNKIGNFAAENGTGSSRFSLFLFLKEC